MSQVFKQIEGFLKKENIEYFSAIKAQDLNVINERILPQNAKSAVMFLIPYYTGPHPYRNISLYCISLDYHLYIKELASRFEGDKGFYFKFFSDTSPVDERAAALFSGLGFLGQNRLLINEKYGSFVFIGTILTDAEFDEDEYAKPQPLQHCSGCGACKMSCAFLRNDSDICLSELTQRKNVTEDELKIICQSPLIWGCDKCQEVCPHNKNVPHTPVEFFRAEHIERLTAELVEGMSKQDFAKRAYSWRGKKTLLRNLLFLKEK